MNIDFIKDKKRLKRILDTVSKIAVMVLIIAGYVYIANYSPIDTLPATATMGKDAVELPVIMYHSLLKDTKHHGKYVISPTQFESDLKYLQEHGYTTILVSDLEKYIKGGDLPEKPILLTFDDGYYNNYYYGFPLLQQYNSKAVIAIIGYYSDIYSQNEEKSAYYSHITWNEIKEMSDSGLVEIANHTYNLHSQKSGKMGVARLSGENDETYLSRISEDIIKMQDLLFEKTGIDSDIFVYPFGIAPEASRELIKNLGFICSFSCEGKKSVITRNPDSLFDLGRYLRPSGISSEEYFSKLGIK